MKTQNTISAEDIRSLIVDDYASVKRMSAWNRGVYLYAHDLLDSVCDEYLSTDYTEMQEQLLNGASSWAQYSLGGCSLIYDGEIAERLCTPSELRKTRNGERMPNSRETWLDVQTRALFQAWCIIRRAARSIIRSK